MMLMWLDGIYEQEILMLLLHSSNLTLPQNGAKNMESKHSMITWTCKATKNLGEWCVNLVALYCIVFLFANIFHSTLSG